MTGSQQPKMITNGEGWRRTFTISLVTAMTTLGGMFGYQQVNPPRPDPFTGIEATALRREMENKLIAAEIRLSQRITTIEAHDDAISNSQNDIWRAIAALPPDRWRRRIESLELWVVRKDPAYKPAE